MAVLTAALLALPARAGSDDDRYTIMKPEPNYEPWLAPKYKSPRGTKKTVKTPKPAPAPAPQVRTQTPPLLYVPQTGRTLPNLPSAGAGAGGAETFQDRAARCTHQAGVYGGLAGDRGSYIRTCINQ